ncbi:MAG: hypothetical protein A2142_01195 [candidate division Zixibacteria bacterium RBG_16_48_11]|nr:MAG: hypothetical protein A2142_01195 [candidate division Zixibacteria bacterium RBG_16_48_11]
MKSFAMTLIILLTYSSTWAGRDKKSQDSLIIVPAPESMPVSKDSIAVVNYVVFLTKLEVKQNTSPQKELGESELNVELKIHIENHSEGTLKDFEIKYLTLYGDNSKEEINTYKLTLKKGKFPLDMAIHTLKEYEFVCTPLKAAKRILKSGGRLYSRILVRYNGSDHFISTRPVVVK